MNMQQMLIQAQKMQREMQKEQDALGKKEFKVSKKSSFIFSSALSCITVKLLQVYSLSFK